LNELFQPLFERAGGGIGDEGIGGLGFNLDSQTFVI
jgi:hypothetical protein